MSKQSSVYLGDELLEAMKIAVVHSKGEWKNVSDFLREAAWEKLQRLSQSDGFKDERQAKIEDYFKNK